MHLLSAALGKLRDSIRRSFPASEISDLGARAKIELNVVWMDQEWIVVGSADKPRSPEAVHRLVIEWGADHATKPSSETSVEKSEHTKPPPTLEELDLVFGPPGFDSSARATVFREAMEGMIDTEALAVIGILGRPEAATLDTDKRQAAHLIQRLLGRGPSGVEAGRTRLLSILQSIPLQTVLENVFQRWKTQDDWIPKSDG